MKKLISARTAGNILLCAMGLLLLFHVLVSLKIIPSDIIWGGQIQNASANLLTLEIIAFIITILFIVILLAKLEYLKVKKLRVLVNIGVWIIFIYFLLNTVGNFASGVSFENLVFAPITILLTLLALRLAIEK